jgi:hypothetical protein
VIITAGRYVSGELNLNKGFAHYRPTVLYYTTYVLFARGNFRHETFLVLIESLLKALAIVNIFETGKPFGEFAAVAVLNDGAGISYGISQFTTVRVRSPRSWRDT